VLQDNSPFHLTFKALAAGGVPSGEQLNMLAQLARSTGFPGSDADARAWVERLMRERGIRAG
jgi:hypothetical protein